MAIMDNQNITISQLMAITGLSRDGVNITFILDGLDLRRDFRCVVDPTQYSHSKPAPDCYLRAAALLGGAPENCTVFEDAVGGIKAAHAAGMRAVAITTTIPRSALQAAGADRIIDSFAEL